MLLGNSSWKQEHMVSLNGLATLQDVDSVPSLSSLSTINKNVIHFQSVHIEPGLAMLV